MNTESDVNTVVDTGEHTHMHTHAPSQDARSPQTQHLPLPQPVHASPHRAWVRVLSIGSLTLVLALLLAACGGGGGDDDDDDADSTPLTNASSIAITPSAGTGSGNMPASMPGSTPAAMPGSTPAAMPGTTPEAEATEPPAADTPASAVEPEPTATTASTGGGGGNGSSPTQASADFPDVHAPLEVGSSAESEGTGASDLSDRPETTGVKVTIVDIVDPATTESPIFQPAEGNRYYAVEVIIEATGGEVVNTGVWTLGTSDGGTYETVMLTGVGEDIFYGDTVPGTPDQGYLVFEIPADATVNWLFMSTSIYVGRNIVFDVP